MQRGQRRGAILGLLALALARCGIDDRLADSSGACGERPAEPGPDGCALICRASVPVNFVENSPQIVVSMDGQPINLTVDTGAHRSSITAATAAALGLPPSRPASGEVGGIGGSQPRRVTDIDELSFGTVRTGARSVDVLVFGAGHRSAGVLGTDVLSRYEVELDFPHGRLQLYEGRACPGRPPGWRADGMVVPFGSTIRGLPSLEVRLDGVAVEAVLDTGANKSAISGALADRVGLPKAQRANARSANADGTGPRTLRVTMHRFDSLEVGADRLHDFEAAVFDGQLASVDMALGGEYLRQRKVWISYSRREVRITSDW